MATPSPSPSPRAYHHGDLRDALVRSGLDILRDEGPEALTLRGVARASGVSQAAPYRHFADRRALVAAVAEAGFRLLQQAMLSAVEADAGRIGMKGMGLAYVQFGVTHPALYRIMFGAEVAKTDDLPSLRETGSEVLGFVQRGVEMMQQQKLVGPGDPAALATTMWAMLHGLVMLTLDGQTVPGLSLDRLVEETMRVMMFGLAPR